MTISFSGLASGLDTSSWVESLVALKQAKIDTLEEEKETVLLSKETLDNIKSFFNSFRSVIEKVTDAQFGIASMDLFAQNLATSANLDVLTATATTEAEEATYNVLVDQLATNSAANSNYCYLTTIVQTTTATSDSKLINVGVKAGKIGVTVNGIERGIEITENDTIQTFIDKLKEIGVEASYNEKTGVFSIDIDAGAINDIDGTGIVDALHLQGVNEGYTSNSLNTSKTDTIYSAATVDTLMSELGAKEGVITIHANDADYQVTLTSTTTLGDFIADLKSHNIDVTLDPTGILTITDAKITDEGTTDILDALGLDLDIYSNTQVSGDLSHKATITQTTTATSDTLLKDLGDGINITDGQTVIIKNSSNEYTTITVGTTTTLGELLSDMTNAGVYAALNKDGTIEISGGTITGGTFDAISALKLTAEPYTAMTTGKPLTETVQKAELVTLETTPISGHFGAPFGVLAGFIHSALVLQTGGPVAGLNLYNNGFSGGLIAIVLYPTLTAIIRHRRPKLRDADYYDLFEADQPINMSNWHTHRPTPEEKAAEAAGRMTDDLPEREGFQRMQKNEKKENG